VQRQGAELKGRQISDHVGQIIVTAGFFAFSFRRL
jgi:hypothetical protein